MKQHHAKAKLLWVKIAKKSSGKESIDWTRAVDVALCWGWIDGQVSPIDATWYAQRFTPRGPKSRWSKINRDRISRLLKDGRMQPAGTAEVARAKKDGRWALAYDSASTMKPVPELARALAKAPRAKAFFATLDSRNRYAILFRTFDAKKKETRERLAAKFVAMLDKRQKPYP